MGRHLTRTAPAAVLATALVVTAVAGLASPASATAPTGNAHPLAASTRANLLAAMHGESFARAAYLAYGGQARTAHNGRAAALFTRTAGVELDDHFALEAELVGLAGPDAENLADAIDGENYETTTMYPQFAAEATADGDPTAAALFTEIAADETAHRDAFAQALTALSGTGSVPRPPKVTPVAVPTGPARSHGRTLTNLQMAMHGEAFASAKYLAYAQHARRTGHPALARLFTTLSDVELREHWAAEAVLAGQVSDTATNLANSAAGENDEATRMYPDYAAQAAAAGDATVAKTLTEIAGDEADHRDAYLAARARLPRH